MATTSDPSPEHTRIVVGEVELDLLVAGPPDGPAMLLLHGFPQTSWCWRHVTPALVAAGRAPGE